MKNKCKTQETNLKIKKNGRLQKISAKEKLEEDENGEREEEWE